MTDLYHQTIDAIRADLAETALALDDAGREDMAADLAADPNVQTVAPQPLRPDDTGGWGPHEHEFCYLGVSGHGTSPGEALRNWAESARRMHDEAEAEAEAIAHAELTGAAA